ncbi:MAG TPA: class I SAM-dependent methyltransferase [Chthoniobacterales bacterium]|nr:class I SAM-dependent methyltransferase [Chthoniobacterales bacterium]
MNNWIDFGLVRDFAAEKTEAYRLCSKPDAWVERFGPDALVSYRTEAAREQILHELDEWALLANQKFERVFGRYLPRQNSERNAPQLISGDASVPLQRHVLERNVCYALDFGAGHSAGLFLDQRENRQFVRRAAPRRLLNCFAYTCSFSVMAALAGGETLSVDLSRKSLDRGRDNFILNKLATDRHRFLVGDVLTVLPRLARKGECFDTIILDPPTFSRSHTGKAWQVEHDFEKLLLAALEVAERDAKILLSTNCSRLTERALEVMGRFCLKTTRRAGSFLAPVALPDFPPGAGARSLWMILR